MIKDFVKAWDLNKNKLEEYIKTHKQEEYDSYEALVKLLFDIVINPTIAVGFSMRFDTEHILTIDDGDYQGTQIFILHKDTYQPGVEEYVYTSVYYGSCSGCDTLLSINSYCEEFPDETQVKDYMQLLLHLLQKCHMMSEDDECEEE